MPSLVVALAGSIESSRAEEEMAGANKGDRDSILRRRADLQIRSIIQEAAVLDGGARLNDLFVQHTGVGEDKPGIVDGVTQRGSIADYSWSELKGLSRAIAAADSDAEGLIIAKAYGLVDKDGMLQGDAKELVLTDGIKSKVRILGFRHDELAGNKGKAGISFEFADVPATHRMNRTGSNAGGWEKSELRGWLNKSFVTLLPDDLCSRVVRVRKPTNNVGHIWSPNSVSVVTATDDKLWLLSANEVYGNLTGVYGAEGIQYQLYANKGVTRQNYKSCQKCGASSWWWLRSPYAHNSGRFRCVYSDGDWGWGNADGVYGVSPGFCF